MKKDHTKLICAVGELSGLFADSTGLANFLQKSVEMVAEHMNCAVCSIYLFYEDSQELVLRANKGLKPEAIGRVKLKLGEGLTGLAMKDISVVCEKQASQTSGYKHFSEIGEEAYESFLAVPIVRGQMRVGVLVIQNTQEDYFNEEDVRAFRAITSQLANTIEMAKVLMDIKEQHGAAKEEPFDSQLKFVQGKSGTQGIACAQGVVWGTKKFFVRFKELPNLQEYTLDDLHEAVRKTEKQLEDLQNKTEETLSDVCSLIFTAQILMLKDKEFIKMIITLVEKNYNSVRAIIEAIEYYVNIFEKLPNAYLKEKKYDIQDMGLRLLENLTGIYKNKRAYQQKIVIARELFPSDILKLSSQNVQGIILLSGGVTAHLSILARSLKIPLVITDTQMLLKIPQQTKILLDADQGAIHINPSKEMLSSFQERINCKGKPDHLKKIVKDFTLTEGGIRIQLLANINLLCDVQAAREVKAEGIGLYRSEFPFIARSTFPSEEEQFIIYKKLVDGAQGKEITFRTLDIGGDKVLAYYANEKEENPFLGMRSIRFSLRHNDIFKQQIRAILRAGAESDLRIMFPMISSADEFIAAREIVMECVHELQQEKAACHQNPKIGMMIELASVLEIIDELALESDFFSIGTNDYVQYMLAIDRTNEKVADLYLPHHPSILRSFKRVVDAVYRKNKELTICGDMAHDARYIAFLLGIGIRKLSIDPCYFFKVQKIIENISLKDAEHLAQQLLAQYKIKDVERLIGK